jgi:hypothetical protein
MLLYSIQEASKKLNISRMTIYNKIRTYPELKKFIKVKNNVKYLMPEGLDLIKNSKIDNNILDNSKSDVKEIDNNNHTLESNIDYKILLKNFDNLQNEFYNNKNNFTESLQDQIQLMKSQLEEKDRQLESKDKQLESKDELLKNFQVLLKVEQENNTKLLTEKSKKSLFDIFKKNK